MTQRITLSIVTVTTCLLLIVSRAPAAPIEEHTLTSANFSLGYGFTGTLTWNASEINPTLNTPTVQGDFKFLPSPTSGHNSAIGAKFPDRVLGDADDTVADYGWSANAANFSVSLLGEWTGATPADAQPTPNYRLKINVTSMRMWGSGYDGYPPGQFISFSETTAGHPASSPTQNVPVVSFVTWDNAVNYSQLIWDAPDYETIGTSFTRTFSIIPSSDGVNGTHGLAIDGFEIFGNVQLIYDAIPEPGSAGLIILTAMGALASRRRR
jgi:hypothetical protein